MFVKPKSAFDKYVSAAVRKERMAQRVSQATLAYGIRSSGIDKDMFLNHINEIAKFLGCSPRDFLPEQPL